MQPKEKTDFSSGSRMNKPDIKPKQQILKQKTIASTHREGKQPARHEESGGEEK